MGEALGYVWVVAGSSVARWPLSTHSRENVHRARRQLPPVARSSTLLGCCVGDALFFFANLSPIRSPLPYTCRLLYITAVLAHTVDPTAPEASPPTPAAVNSPPPPPPQPPSLGQQALSSPHGLATTSGPTGGGAVATAPAMQGRLARNDAGQCLLMAPEVWCHDLELSIRQHELQSTSLSTLPLPPPPPVPPPITPPASPLALPRSAPGRQLQRCKDRL